MANPVEEVVIKLEKIDESDQQPAPVTQAADSTVPTINNAEPPVEIKQERDATTPVTVTPAFTEAGDPVGPPQPQVFGQQPQQEVQEQTGLVQVKEEPLDEQPAEQPQKEKPASKQPDTQQTINMLNAFSEQMAAVAVKTEPGLTENEVQETADVPDGFFDDFMADDFMEGLNVIDEDDEEETKATVQRKNKEKENQKKRKEKMVKNIKAEEGEKQRRDPEKTRRDIQRDKAKCAQDKQKKMIKERLSVVETGLVPPGMEMEVELQDVQQNDESKQDRRRRHSRSTDNRSSRRLSTSPSTSRRHHSRSLATDGRRSPSPVRRFKRSPDSRISNASSRRSHRKSPSPRRRGRRSRSRSRDRYRSRTRSRSRSPRRRPKQKHFLEELAEKLNETRSSHVTPAAAVMNAAQQGMYPPTPAFYPMQPPVMQPPQPQFDCYDENYFLNGGAGGSGMVMMDGSGMMAGGPYMAPQPVPAPVPPPAQFVPPAAAAPQPISYGMMPQVAMEPVRKADNAKRARTTPTPQQQQTPAPSKDDLSKLLAEKKISLSEFLSLTAKNEARPATTFNWQEKLKVLSRIQEAIDYLSGSRLYEGRLKVRKIHEKPQPSNGDSPLTRNPTVILPFTSIDANQQANFATSFPQKLNNLLRFLDINLSFKVPPPPAINAANGTTEKGKSRRGTRKRGQGGSRMKDCMLQKMTQTDPINCEECEKRKEVRKVNVGIQCGTSITHNEATQFPDPNEEYPRRSSSSLASMTPAQLLRQVANRVSGVMEPREERFGMRDGRLDRDIRMRDDRMIGGRCATPGYTNDIEMEEEGYLGRSAAQFIPRASSSNVYPAGSSVFPTSGVRGRMPAQMRPVAPPAPRFGGYNRF